jgi:hypothetical protein
MKRSSFPENPALKSALPFKSGRQTPASFSFNAIATLTSFIRTTSLFGRADLGNELPVDRLADQLHGDDFGGERVSGYPAYDRRLVCD